MGPRPVTGRPSLNWVASIPGSGPPSVFTLGTLAMSGRDGWRTCGGCCLPIAVRSSVRSGSISGCSITRAPMTHASRALPGPRSTYRRDAFVAQLGLAAELRRPPTVHGLNAWDRLEQILNHARLPRTGFLLHAFSGPSEKVPAFIDAGALLLLQRIFSLLQVHTGSGDVHPASTRSPPCGN
jgi:hypothetical protein